MGWVAVRRRVGEVVGGGEGDIFRWDGFVRKGVVESIELELWIIERKKKVLSVGWAHGMRTGWRYWWMPGC